jgi:hypothetical protein
MRKHIIKSFALIFLISAIIGTVIKATAQSEELSYKELHKNFASPDYSYWGEVPLWWWEADSLDESRITWQLEELSGKGVKAVCPIQRSPARCHPESFSDEWWKTLSYVHKECERLGMRLWVYDQLGYGQYGWFEKAAAQIENTGTSQINFHSFEVNADNEGLRLKMPEGILFEARAYQVINDTAWDEKSIDIAEYIHNDSLVWSPSQGEWKVAITTLTPYRSFYMNEPSTDIFINQLYQRIEDVVGEDAMGKSLIGVFQDEHPPTPRNIYTSELSESFKQRYGYDIARAIPALHFDVGYKTPKYRIDYLDAYISFVEKTYWEKVYNWTTGRNLLTSHDNWGRNNIYRHSEGYIDYFRTQRWYSSPGLDDWSQKPLEERNYYDTKIASSIARLYKRPRVWAEVFHSSGWGRTPDQTLSWLSTLYAFGANLYDEHGLYYSLNAGTWEHAAGDPHWRQPYWGYYQEISDWVARMSYVMSQGNQVADVAVHYPVVSLLAEIDKSELDYNHYMKLSRIIYNEGIDNDIIDDHSIVNATVQDGRIQINGNSYQALVFGAESTIRLAVLEKALDLAQSGGVVLFYGKLPSASAENGRDDARLASVIKEILNTSSIQAKSEKVIDHNFKSGGYAAFLSDKHDLLPSLLTQHIDRDFIGNGGDVYVSHRRIGELDVYLIQNTEDKPIQLDARFRIDGVPELWDAFSGTIKEVNDFERKNGYTHTRLTLEGNVAKLMVIKPGDQKRRKDESPTFNWNEKVISKDWLFSVMPTCDNQWGDFSWPPSREKMGPEVRQLKHMEESGTSGIKLGWNKPDFEDENWDNTLYSTGPYWLALEEIPESADIIQTILEKRQEIEAGDQVQVDGTAFHWEKLSFSKTIGLAKPSPWGGHSGYPDGHYDKNFIHLKKGRKLLFTRIHSPAKQNVGLNVQLRNSTSRLWVNGKEESFHGAVGNLPLNKGYNYILLDLPDGTGGMLFVRRDSPALVNTKDGNTGLTLPTLSDASWIWVGNTEGAYFRKSFEMNELPEIAHTIVTGVSGFRLFINGEKVEEDIGPWATWDYPKSVNIRPYLKEGNNVFAVWGQFYKGINVSFSSEYQGFILAMKAINNDGTIVKLETDNSWKGHLKEFDEWETIDFNDSDWDYVTVKGKAGDNPWGNGFLQNMGGSTTPYRPLSLNLTSPYIQVFNEMPDIVYDVKNESADRMGWYRFEAPPGIKEIAIPTDKATVWVNGAKVSVNDGIAKIQHPPSGVSHVAIRLKMERGEYAGAAFEQPIKLKIGGGTIQPGLWSDYALPTYSGIGVYKQTITFNKAETQQKIAMDLGEVYVAAEVFVNAKSAGIRVAAPYKFDLSGLVQSGENEIEIRVANTLAPHYSMPKKAMHLGPLKSGLVGPIQLKISK